MAREINYAGIAICWGICFAAVGLIVCNQIYKDNFWVKIICPCAGVLLAMAFFHIAFYSILKAEVRIGQRTREFGQHAATISNTIVRELTPASLKHKIEGTDLK